MIPARPVEPAGLSAETTVAAPSAEHGGKVARTGDAHAVGPVNEGFLLNRDGVADGLDLA